MMRRAQLCLRLAQVVSAILAGLLFAQFAHAQTALEWAAQGMGQAQAQNIQLRKENVELKAKFEAKPEVKK